MLSSAVLRVVGLSACAVACAPAVPTLSGGRTTPSKRSDVALGSSFRIPVTAEVIPRGQPPGDVRDALLAATVPGGAAPVAFYRYGLGPQTDVGVLVAGTFLQAQLRTTLELVPGLRLVAGLSPGLGTVHPNSAAAPGGLLVRAGGMAPVVLTLDVISLLELWVGTRLGLDTVQGDLDESGGARGVSLHGLRTGGVAGLALGFRRMAVLAELAVDHEFYWGTTGETSVSRGGWVLTPSFALRLRL